MPIFNTFVLASASLAALLVFYLATVDITENLSPQGCRMSWMSPSYIVQADFNVSWTPLANRYSLSLYREVGWEHNEIQGTPVLFIPGNAGSSHQVRSIASSAARQFYSAPYAVASEFASRTLKALDVFAVEFNEDLSAFHGPTLESQIAYTSYAITYILSLYPPGTTIIVMGHSMGGVVATSLLPSSDISAIITMSTPHTLPPARFDSRIDHIYAKNQLILTSDPTPIVSLCGGATDMMIPSESCVLPTVNSTVALSRRTVFTSALEGAWTGVGHREMVWCHQVRWRVARAALEIGAASTSPEKALILDQWLRDGHTLPPTPVPASAGFTLTDPEKYRLMDEATHLVIMSKYLRGSATFLLPLPPARKTPLKAVILVGLGSILSVGPQKPVPLKVSGYMCTPGEEDPVCVPMAPSLLKLMPNPSPGRPFPVPEEGTDESEGVVVYEADIPLIVGDEDPGKRWFGVHVEDGNARGWVVAGIAMRDYVVEAPTALSLLFKDSEVLWPDTSALRSHFIFPNLMSNALLVYKYSPITPEEETWCSDPLLAPLLSHTSQPVETHYFPVGPTNDRILLHTHSNAPYVASTAPRRGLEFVVYSSGAVGCTTLGFTIGIDWSATLGRLASRFPTTLVAWSVGVVAMILFTAWGTADQGALLRIGLTTFWVVDMPSVGESLKYYGRYTFKRLLSVSLVVALLPLPVSIYVGTGGNFFFAAIAPLLLLIASGLVAYLGCWLIYLFNCASSARQLPHLIPAAAPGAAVIPLIRVANADGDAQEDKPLDVPNHEAQRESLQKYRLDNHNHNMHLLLLMTCLLPLVAPVLAVWVRTLFTAGLTTPFDGDHTFLNAAPFLVLVDFASWSTGVLFERQR
ncbi:hypothetical protein DXG01_012907 [Tephrocybe rancida]|nr:hypothetical protein DXG01_012907 [Tephrocybe rancida]